jgi:hypothetical protein
MAKPTLLEIVQDILSDSDGDEVNSISDTVESDQCARVVRDTFRNIVDVHDISYHETITQLEATGTSTPAQMTRPAGLHSIEWIKYDKRVLVGDDVDLQEVTYMDPLSFIEMTASRTASDANVTTMAMTTNYNVLIKTDEAPTYFTFLEGYDDIIFDSYDSALETNLQASKTLVWGVVKPTLALSDGAIADLPENLFTLLRNEARAFYFDVYGGGTTKEVDEKKRHSQVRAQRKRHITKGKHDTNTGPHYGRKGR